MIKVSVILIVYNGTDLLKKCLLSLNSQSYLPDEVIVTDDGSEEDILSVLNSLSGKLKYKLKYVRQENKGFRAAKARNNGVRLAENDLLVFYDQDIIGTENYLKTFVDHAEESKFIVSYPIRLTKDQSELITESTIATSTYLPILQSKQIFKIKKQFIKDCFEYFKKNIGLSKRGPKLRSGVFAVHKSNYTKVNGFDEMFEGWGNEDDDLGNRLYSAGINGYNPFWNEYPIHLYHESNSRNGKRINKEYYKVQKKKIENGLFECEYGLNNQKDNDELKVVEI
jgi:GT2 family glycosyltransferase